METMTLPKQIVLGQKIDPFEKCVWILEKQFNCQRMHPVNVSRLTSSTAVVNFLHLLQLPVLLSVVGKGAFYNHVVVAWRNKIIDFKARTTYIANVANIKNLCGVKNPFVQISRACVICPSKKMKHAVGDFTDWGEKNVVSEMLHWFTKTKN
jgi:hypothetical protein